MWELEPNNVPGVVQCCLREHFRSAERKRTGARRSWPLFGVQSGRTFCFSRANGGSCRRADFVRPFGSMDHGIDGAFIASRREFIQVVGQHLGHRFLIAGGC